MAKSILIILGHPDKDSYCGALARVYGEGAREAGAHVRTLHLGEMKFDNVLWKGYREIQRLEPALVQAQNDITWAEHLVMVFPTWWTTMPALMKGFFDRIWLPGFAFQNAGSGLRPVKLLKNRTARLIITMDAPSWYYEWVLGSPGHKMVKRGILEFSGISPVRVTEIGSMKGSTEKQRRRWLGRVRHMGVRML